MIVDATRPIVIYMGKPENLELIDGEQYLCKGKEGWWELMTFRNDSEEGFIFCRYSYHVGVEKIEECGLLPK